MYTKIFEWWTPRVHLLGDPCKHKSLSFRIVAGTWVLAAFVFVQAYQSILFSYIISPITLPLINSVGDLAESKDINFLVRRGGTFEYFFKVYRNNIHFILINTTRQLNHIRAFLQSSNKTIYRKVQAIIDASPRCTLTSDCIKMITPASRNVYADVNWIQIFLKWLTLLPCNGYMSATMQSVYWHVTLHVSNYAKWLLTCNI